MEDSIASTALSNRETHRFPLLSLSIYRQYYPFHLGRISPDPGGRDDTRLTGHSLNHPISSGRTRNTILDQSAPGPITKMVGKSLIAPLFLGLQLLSSAKACSPPNIAPSNTTGPAPAYPTVVVGSDDPADLATTGFTLSHFSLNVNNLTASVDFYTKVFGMRLIFEFWATEKMAISYLAHSHGGKNGTAYQTVSELNRNKNNMEGLLELIYYDYDGAEQHSSTIQSDNTFSHLGMVVPDIAAAGKRFEDHDVTVLRASGAPATEEFEERLSRVYGIRGVWGQDKQVAIDVLNTILQNVPAVSTILPFITDLDGNLIEVQPQELPQIPIRGRRGWMVKCT